MVRHLLSQKLAIQNIVDFFDKSFTQIEIQINQNWRADVERFIDGPCGDVERCICSIELRIWSKKLMEKVELREHDKDIKFPMHKIKRVLPEYSE